MSGDGPSKRQRVGDDGDRAVKEVLRLAWADDADAVEEARLAFERAEPFPHGQVQDLISSPALLDALQEQVMQNEYLIKENDLFSFLQTKDLAASVRADQEAAKDGALEKFITALYSQRFRDVLERITGARGLSDKLDLTSSVYAHTNNLLCHDDELSSRRIAFILYLVPADWAEEDGGALDLFTVDADKQPNGIMRIILPRRNTLLFFEVSDRSYHQVAEVLSRDKPRVSIGGWFHGPPTVTPLGWRPLEPTKGRVAVRVDPSPGPLGALEPAGAELSHWVNEVYLREDTQNSIRELFEQESCVQLHDFVRQDRLAELKAALGAASWEAVGPYQKRHFGVASPPSTSDANAALAAFARTLCSRVMAGLVAALTNLSVTAAAAQTRRFLPGCYTLVHDRDAADKAAHASEVDLLWTFVEDDDRWADEEEPTGGQVVYAAEGEEEPLLVVAPRANMLTVVYRNDADTQAFVKFVNSRAPSPRYDFLAVCAVEADEDGGSGEDGEADEDEEADEDGEAENQASDGGDA